MNIPNLIWFHGVSLETFESALNEVYVDSSKIIPEPILINPAHIVCVNAISQPDVGWERSVITLDTRTNVYGEGEPNRRSCFFVEESIEAIKKLFDDYELME